MKLPRLIATLAAALFILAAAPAKADRPDVLEVITLDGVIDESAAERITKDVEKINENARAKAVLLIVDTPGGGVVASGMIYEELSKLKVPVVVWCQSLCASGGVYISMAPSIKYIAVRSETIGGSVGVRSSATRFNRLLDWARIDNETYKSGRLKDAGSPVRPAEEDEKAYLQGIVDSLAKKFYGIVDKARGKKISAEHWADIKTARIFIGDEVVKIGLADAVATKAEVIAKAKDLSGSKTIYTREELKKMSSQANDNNHDFSMPSIPLKSTFGDVPFLIDLVKEVRAGESIRFEYRLPLKF